MENISWTDGQSFFKQTHDLAVSVYRATRNFPIIEGKGLVYEMRQATLAVSAFLSDALRKDQKSYLLDVLEAVQRHLQELRRNLVVSQLLGYLKNDDFDELHKRTQTAMDELNAWRESLAGVAPLVIKPLKTAESRAGEPAVERTA